MHTTETTTAATGKVKNTSLAKFKRGMEAALASAGPSLESKFAEAYEDIEIALANDIAQKIIIESLNSAYELKLHPKRFRELLQGERDHRNKAGNAATCKTCSRPLNTTMTLDSTGPETADRTTDSVDRETTA